MGFDQRAVKVGQGRLVEGAGWTGGGPIVDYYLPAFYADSAGVTVQIERIDAAGATCYGVGTGVETYTVPNGAANAQGVLALVNSVTARTFRQEDHPHQFGFLATAIGGGIHVGRCGLDLVNGAPPNTNFIASGGNEPVFSDFLPQGLVGAWCCVADSHGWCWPFIDDGAGSGGGGTSQNLQLAPITASAGGATTLVAATAGKAIAVYKLVLRANAQVNWNLQSHATTATATGTFYEGGQGTGQVLPNDGTPWFVTKVGEALDINLSGAVAVGGELGYALI